MTISCRECGSPLDAGADFQEGLCEECLFDRMETCDACGHPDRLHDPDDNDRCEACTDNGGPCQ